MSRLTEIAGKIAGAARGARAALEGYKGIFRTLKREHGELTTLMNRLAESGDVGMRKDLFPRIRTELLAHGKAEQKEFYPVLQRFEATRDLASHGSGEHDRLESLLEQLAVTSFDDASWLETFAEMRRIAIEHFDEEESQLFPAAKSALSGDDAEEMNQRYGAERSRQIETLEKPH